MSKFSLTITDSSSTISSVLQGATGATGATGADGAGWTGVTYDDVTGTFTFTSDDGLGYTSGSIKAGLDAAVASVESLYDQFGDQYLGTLEVEPTTDNDGDPLVSGTLYYNSTVPALYVYNGATWDQVGLVDAGNTLDLSAVDEPFIPVSGTQIFEGSLDLQLAEKTIGTVQSVTLTAGGVTQSELNNHVTEDDVEGFALNGNELTISFGGLFPEEEAALTSAVGSNVTIAWTIFGDPYTAVYTIDSVVLVRQGVDTGGGYTYDITLAVTYVSGDAISDGASGSFSTFDNQSTYTITSFLYNATAADVYVIEMGAAVPNPSETSYISVNGVSATSSGSVTESVYDFLNLQTALNGTFDGIDFFPTEMTFYTQGSNAPNNLGTVLPVGSQVAFFSDIDSVTIVVEITSVLGYTLGYTVVSSTDPTFYPDLSYLYWDQASTGGTITYPVSAGVNTLLSYYSASAFSTVDDPSSYLAVGDTVAYKARYAKLSFTNVDPTLSKAITYDDATGSVTYEGITPSAVQAGENNILYSTDSFQVYEGTTSADYSGSIALGLETANTGFNGVALGAYATTYGNFGVAVGGNATTYEPSSVAVGSSSKAEFTKTVALGNFTYSGQGEYNTVINEPFRYGTNAATFPHLVMHRCTRSASYYFETNASAAVNGFSNYVFNNSPSVGTGTQYSENLRQRLNMPTAAIARVKLDWIITEEDYQDLPDYYASGSMEFMYFSEALDSILWIKNPTVDVVGTNANAAGLNIDIVNNPSVAGSLYTQLLTNGTDTTVKRVQLNWSAFYSDPNL